MANHAKAWDAKLLAYVLPRQNTVAGLPGGFTSPIMSSGTASEIALVLLEDDTMLKFLLTATMLAVLSFAPMSLAQTADGETPAEETVCDGQSGALWGLCVAYCEAMDCDSEYPNADETACTRVLGNYMDKALELGADDVPPCEASETDGEESTGDSGTSSSEPTA